MNASFGLAGCLVSLLLVGCAGGPAADDSNLTVVGAKFQEPVTMELVANVGSAKEKCLRDGYKVVRTADYSGKSPTAVELEAEARRLGASHVIYSVRFISLQSGNWNSGFNRFGAGGGISGGVSDVSIVFLGK